MQLHWMVVGYVSPGAQDWIERVGGQVRVLSSESPSLVGVGLAYDNEGVWKWQRGRQQYHVGIEFWTTGTLQEASTGIEFWTTGTLQEASTGIELQYLCMEDARPAMEGSKSVEQTYLILPDEHFSLERREAYTEEVPELEIQQEEKTLIPSSSEGGFLEDWFEYGDHPF